jgi:hypothetical protein
MLVNLPNGKTVDMSFEDYLRLGMDEYSYLMQHNVGFETEDPFTSSVLRKGAIKEKIEKVEDDPEDDGYYEETPLYEPE